MLSEVMSSPTGVPPVHFAHSQAQATHAPREIEHTDHTGQEETEDEYLDHAAGPVVQLVRQSERTFRAVSEKLLEDREAGRTDIYA